MQDKLAVLEFRMTLVDDAKAVKRLQRAYGYYIDKGLWDEAADLFADDGSIEIALDGVYLGKARVRQYLRALGHGREGLAYGELNEHIQLQGVVNVAPDGNSARGRWRCFIIQGKLGDHAYWGEGPYENEYVKDNGVWKIKKLHWYQTFLVPYDGGWAKNRDVNGGKYVSDTLAPDSPPSVQYKTWPDTFLPPFHFDNPVTGKDVRKMGAVDMAAVPKATTAATPEALAGKLAALARQVGLLEDEHQIENLQRIYGFYVDKSMWTQVADLFADDGTLEIGGRGVFVGKQRVFEYLNFLGDEFPRDGWLYDHMQLQPVIHVAPDGKTARGRWRFFTTGAEFGKFHQWGMGVYENTYAKEDGVWKIKNLHAYFTMYTPYDDGWGRTADPNTRPEQDLPPDLPPSEVYDTYPAVYVPPFHYPNPVTGRPVYQETVTDYVEIPTVGIEMDEVALMLDKLEQRITLLEDAEAVENLHAIYGYYLAGNQWDELADIFADNGSIEIAMRGVYVGKKSIRRNLDLYGKQGIHYGVLHNHMQFQPVINIAPDGGTARMRSRAFSILGEYGKSGSWMGGVYENEFVKQDGVWRIRHDQVFNTYFAPYDQGWKDLQHYQPPGITASNPPDKPPSMPFNMYPRAFLPPYHYPNPVTGKKVSWTAPEIN